MRTTRKQEEFHVVEVSSDEVDKVVIAAALAQHRRSLH